MKRLSVFALSAFGSALAAVAAPSVLVVGVSQDAASGSITVDYTLSGEAAIITLDIQTNYVENAEKKWASVGPANLRNVGGDVNRLVQPGDRKAYWSADVCWTGGVKAASDVRAVVSAWTKNAPPDWMAIHMLAPYEVSYYTHAELVPGGITAERYKKEYMLFRKIPAKNVVWTSGLSPSQARYSERNQWHKVRLTYDYYMAVYECTNAQREGFNNGKLPADDPMRPVWYASQASWRGSSDGAKWPTFDGDEFDFETSRKVDKTSFLGKLRDATGLMVDLPTEHEWEYACRAGSPGYYYTETTRSDVRPTDIESKIAYTGKGKPTVVGTLIPNCWGLYDTIGNIQECCLDYPGDFATLYPDQPSTGTVYENPVGAKTGTARVFCGGDARYGGAIVMSRESRSTDVYNTEGARLCVPLR